MPLSPHDGVHLDPELLALLALGERPGTPEEYVANERHLSACGVCSSELDQLSAVVRSARRVTLDDAPVAPPESVWAGIQAELAADAAPAPVVQLSERRRRAPGWLALAAAACLGLVVGGGGVYAATTGGSAATPQVLAAAPLEPLEGQTAKGEVTVVSTANGPQVSVDVSGLAKSDGFYEVWLLDKDATKLIALGVLDGTDKGVFAMPPGVSMSDYPVVDVSLEPQDGNPEHSHNSLVRGILPA